MTSVLSRRVFHWTGAKNTNTGLQLHFFIKGTLLKTTRCWLSANALISPPLQVAGVILLEDKQTLGVRRHLAGSPSVAPPSAILWNSVRERASEGTWERRGRCTRRWFSPPTSSSYTWWPLRSSPLPTGNVSPARTRLISPEIYAPFVRYTVSTRLC